MTSVINREENEYICEGMISLITSTLFLFFEQFNNYGSDYEIVKSTYKKLEALRDIYNKHIARTEYLFQNSPGVLTFQRHILSRIRMPEPKNDRVIYLDDYRRAK